MKQRLKAGTPPKAVASPVHVAASGGGSGVMAGGISWGPWALGIDLVVLVALAAAARLWGLATPNSVVFDEYHFGKFINW
jgi:hypothetical protein